MNVNSLNIEKTFRLQVRNSQFPAAMKTWESFLPDTLQEQRLKGHLLGRLLIKKGDYSEACSVLQDTYNRFGSNISLLQDLCSAYYLDSNVNLWKITLKELRQQFQEARELISKPVQARMYRDLGKFSEEEGSIKETVANFKSGLEIASKDGRLLGLRLNLRNQLLRTLSQYKQTESIGELYQESLEFSSNHQSEELFIETEQSLILAEYELISPEMAIERFNKLIAKISLSSRDYNLIFFDLLERLSVDGAEIGVLTERNSPRIDQLDVYERALYELIICDKPLTLVDTIDLSRRMSPACWLRVITVSMNKMKPFAALESQFKLLLQTFGKEDREFWISRAGKVSERSIFWRYEKESRILRSSDNKQLSLDKKLTIAALIEALAISSEIPVEEIINRIWESDYNESYYDRLRTLIKRVNKLLFQFSGRTNCISISNGSVRLNGITLATM